MTLAFDTNILIEIDRLNSKLLERLQAIRNKFPQSPVIPFPVVSEYYYGFLDTRKKDEALRTLGDYETLQTSKNSALLFAELKNSLRKKGRIIQDMDLFIAAVCIDAGATLVTFDKQFEEIKELAKIILEF